jgi:hypothetical protein
VKAYLKGAFFYFIAFTLPLALILNLFLTMLSDKLIKVSIGSKKKPEPLGSTTVPFRISDTTCLSTGTSSPDTALFDPMDPGSGKKFVGSRIRILVQIA